MPKESSRDIAKCQTASAARTALSISRAREQLQATCWLYTGVCLYVKDSALSTLKKKLLNLSVVYLASDFNFHSLYENITSKFDIILQF